MTRAWWLCLFALPLSTASAETLQAEWDWVASLESAHTRQSPFFPSNLSEMNGQPSESSTQSVNVLLDAQLSFYDWTALLAVKGDQVWSSDSSQSFDADFIAQELFWQGSLDIQDHVIDITLGKVRLDWGVGYGYRPLDIFKPYRRNPIGIQVEEGTGTALLSSFDMQGEWSLVYTDSSWTQQEGSELEEATEQQGFGFRRYALVGDTEWQAIGYYDDIRKGLIGGSIVTVLNTSWALHSSATYQRYYYTYQQPQASSDSAINELLSPVSLVREEDGFQWLVGLNWANAVGNNIILEYWYDSRSWDKSDWSQALNRSEILSQSAQLSPLAASYANGYLQTNLVAHNVMFHWSLDSSAWSQWEWSNDKLWLEKLTPTFDVLLSPEDGGVIATQWLNYLAHDNGDSSLEMEIAARFMTGDSDSAYANLSDKYMILFNVKGRF